MISALLHFRHPSRPPVGIWWLTPGGTLLSDYLPGHDAEETLGRYIMLNKVPEVPWETYFSQLEDRLPIGSGWERVSLNEDPAKYLARLNRSAA